MRKTKNNPAKAGQIIPGEPMTLSRDCPGMVLDELFCFARAGAGRALFNG
jgi:hypothetical protein